MTTVTAQFLVDGQPRVPDADSVVYTLYGQLGEVLASDVPVSTGPTTTAVKIVTDPATDVRTLRFEKRTLVLSWTTGGAPFSQRIIYRLTAFLNHTVTPDQVRSYLGIAAKDLSDADIDIVSAYLEAEERLTAELLDISLASGGLVEQRANDVILYLAVLRLMPSLQMRVAQEETNGTIGFKRPQIKSFEDLRATTEDRLQDAISTITVSTGVSDWNLIAATTPTDPITGE